MNAALAEAYSSASQKARVLTEAWVADAMFCPRCGHARVSRFENNRPVADFFCPACGNQYELKSRNGAALDKINDGAYATMIDRITGQNNPDFFFLSYTGAQWRVNHFFFVPKHFFTPDIIEKRRPLSGTAKRAGWTGCNILIHRIPAAGRIPIVVNGVSVEKREVVERVAMADRLMVADLSARGWLMDVLGCADRIPGVEFTLAEMYAFEGELAAKHPENHNIRPKIRQQLQQLRDRGVIEFIAPGRYRKVVRP